MCDDTCNDLCNEICNATCDDACIHDVHLHTGPVQKKGHHINRQKLNAKCIPPCLEVQFFSHNPSKSSDISSVFDFCLMEGSIAPETLLEGLPSLDYVVIKQVVHDPFACVESFSITQEILDKCYSAAVACEALTENEIPSDKIDGSRFYISDDTSDEEAVQGKYNNSDYTSILSRGHL